MRLMSVVFVNAQAQTVDLIDFSDYDGFLEESRDTTDLHDDSVSYPSIIRNVPYLTSSAADFNTGQLARFITDYTPRQKVLKSLEEQGEQFLFGKHANPAYLEKIQDKYYKGRGTHINTVTSGEMFRPFEGSVCLYDETINLVFGFVSVSSYYASRNKRYILNSKNDTDSAYYKVAQNAYDSEDALKNYYDVFRDSLGVADDRAKREKLDPKFRNINSNNIRNLYPIMSDYSLWEYVNPAHVTEIDDYHVKYLKNDLKRIAEVYDLPYGVGNGVSNGVSLQPNNSRSLFGVMYVENEHMLSPYNYDLYNENIHRGYVKSDDINFKDIAWKHDNDVYIMPESGLRLSKDGRLILYSDLYNSHADLTKPILGYEAFNNDTYNLTFKSAIARTSRLLGDSDNYIIQEYDNDASPASVRKIPVNEQYGNYFVIDPKYVEISADVERGGWLLEKSRQAIKRASEVYKVTVFESYETFTNDSVVGLFESRNGRLYEVDGGSDDIRLGTFAVDAPMMSFRSLRQHFISDESIALESQSQSHDAGIYISDMNLGASTGGAVVVKAGVNKRPGGDEVSASTPPQASKGGIISLEADTIQLNANRIIHGQIREDHKDKLDDLNIGQIVLSLIPAEGAAAEKIAALLRELFPIQIDTPKALLGVFLGGG